MNWHVRYSQQAGWTRDLRAYLFEEAGVDSAKRTLEVGCGTGAILAEMQAVNALHGLDIELAALKLARIHAPSAALTCADAHALPYPEESFQITFCHFLLLWVFDPLQVLREMKRVTRKGGHILALAEPDYTARVDAPPELSPLGDLQRRALQRQGADPSLGGRLAELFHQAGIMLVETGAIRPREGEALTLTEWKQEWAVLESDLADSIPEAEIRRFKQLDLEAMKRGERKLYVPTYFAWGRA